MNYQLANSNSPFLQDIPTREGERNTPRRRPQLPPLTFPPLHNLRARADLFLKSTNKLAPVQTGAFDHGKKILNQHSCLGIVGRSCSGKTTLIRNIIHSFKKESGLEDEMIILEVTKPGHLNDVPIEPKARPLYLLILDDMFEGDSNLGSWQTELRHCYKMVELSKIIIVFSIKTLFFNKYKTQLSTNELFNDKHLIFLHKKDYELTYCLKQEILQRQYKKFRLKPDENFIEMVIDKLSSFGFLKWCSTLKSSKTLKEHSFEETNEFLEEELRGLDEGLFKILVLILLLRGQLKSNIESPDPNFGELKHLLCIGSRKGVLESCEILKGTYLSVHNSAYVFIEPCVSDAVIKICCTKYYEKYKRMLMQHLPLDFLMDMIYLGKFEIEFDEHEALSKRMLKVVFNINDWSMMLKYKCLQQGTLVTNIMNHLTAVDRLALAKCLFPKICEHGKTETLECIVKFLCLSELDIPGYSCGYCLELIVRSDSNTDTDVNQKLFTLIQNKMTIENVTPQGGNIFHLVCKFRGVACLQFLVKLIENSQDYLLFMDHKGRTPFHVACQKSDFALAESIILCAGNIFINMVDKNQKISLHYAVENCDVKLIEFLVEKGANRKISDENGQTALHNIRYCKMQADHIVSLLVHDHENVINTVDKNGFSSLHLCCQDGNVEAVRALIQHEADVTLEDDKSHRTALQIVCSDQNNPNACYVLKLLLQIDHDLNQMDRFGETALHCAVKEGMVDCVQELLGHNANPNITTRNELEQSPLHYIVKAPSFKRLELYYALKENQANLALEDGNGQTLLDLVEECGFDDLKTLIAKSQEIFV